MRILFVTNNYTPYSGGVVSSINATVNALHHNGHEVIVIAPNFLGKKHVDPPWVKRAPSFFRFRYRTNHMAFLWRPTSFLRAHIEDFNPDIIHIHHPFLLGSLAVRLARQYGIKTVFTYHTIYEAYAHYVPLFKTIARRIIPLLVLRVCARVDHIIVPSRAIQSHLAERHINHTTVIPSGLKKVFLDIPFTRKKIEPVYRLLYVGRFVQEKNITALFDVMKQLPKEYELILVGYGDYISQLKLYAYEKKGLDSHIRFVEKPPQDVLIEEYKKAHLFLFPSHKDTQGIVMAEAMACATPVIAFDGPGQRDIITHGNNGFIVQDVDQMATTIQSVTSQIHSYEILQENAYKRSQYYDPALLIQRIMTVYK